MGRAKGPYPRELQATDMSKYKRPPQEIAEKPVFFIRHWWSGLVEWVEANKDHLLTGVLVIAVVILGLVVYKRYAATRTLEAWKQLGLAESAAQLEGAAARYEKTPVGPFLKLRLADQYVNTGQAEKALAIYSEMAAANDEFSERAEYSLGFAQETTGKFDDAKKTFEGLAAKGGFWGKSAQATLESQGERVAAYANLAAAKAAATAEAEGEKAEGTVAALMSPAATAPAATEAAGTPVSPGEKESRQGEELNTSGAPSEESRQAEQVQQEQTGAAGAPNAQGEDKPAGGASESNEQSQ